MLNKLLSISCTMLFLSVTAWYLWPEESLNTKKNIDYILVIKHQRKMTVFSKGKPLKTYNIALGRVPIGKKQFEGDKKTPEGIYIINDKNPKSAYHLNLGISYPNKADIAYANEHKLQPGSLIKIHGLKNGMGFIGKFHRLLDWTQGCIAVTNYEIEELYHHTPIGTRIEIRP